MNCATCQIEYQDNQLISLCCQTHQYCISCVNKILLNNNTISNQTCYCCYRYIIGRYQDCETLDDCEMQAVDYLTLFENNILKVRGFDFKYIKREILKDNIMGFVDYEETIGHQPLYTYEMPININILQQISKTGIQRIKFIENYIQYLIRKCLNNMVIRKQIDYNILYQLIELQKSEIEKKMNQKKKIKFNINITINNNQLNVQLIPKI